MPRSASERLEELAHGVLGPMVLGGTIHLVAPFGANRALALGEGRRIVDDDLRARIDVARVRRVRLLAAIDALPDISPAEWALVACLNDILQATNHELSGPFTRGRHLKLLSECERLLGAIGAPRTTLEVLVRHATFARMLEIVRTDTTVRAWAGTIVYRGQKPERSMTFWPNLRRVRVEPRPVPLHSMPEGLAMIQSQAFQGLLAELLAKSPLTDIACVSRPAPAFSWSRETLRLIAYPNGRALALRALSRVSAQAAVESLKAANQALAADAPARPLVEGFVAEMLERATDARP